MSQDPEIKNTKDCVTCGKKHIAACVVVLEEILNGYAGDARHEAYLEGNLAHAEEHLLVNAPGLSNMIRLLRLDVFKEMDCKAEQHHLEQLHQIYESLKRLGEPQPVQEIKTVSPEEFKNPAIVTQAGLVRTVATKNAAREVRTPVPAGKPCTTCGGKPKAPAPLPNYAAGSGLDKMVYSTDKT